MLQIRSKSVLVWHSSLHVVNFLLRKEAALDSTMCGACLGQSSRTCPQAIIKVSELAVWKTLEFNQLVTSLNQLVTSLNQSMLYFWVDLVCPENEKV